MKFKISLLRIAMDDNRGHELISIIKRNKKTHKNSEGETVRHGRARNEHTIYFVSHFICFYCSVLLECL